MNIFERTESSAVEDYYLVMGQCAGDSVVTQMAYGNYLDHLYSIVAELRRVDPDTPVLVKLHPYMDGEKHECPEFLQKVIDRLLQIGRGSSGFSVVSGMKSAQPYIAKAKCVLLANSGAGLEAMMQGKPIISWGVPEYHWVTYPLRHLCDLRRAVLSINDWFDAELQYKWLGWYCYEYTIRDIPSAGRRVRELVSPTVQSQILP